MCWCWGSEFPIFYQRNEAPEAVRDWLLDLGVALNTEERTAFYSGNAQRLLFTDPPPPAASVPLPDWVAEQVDAAATVYLFPPNPIYIPMAAHGVLLDRYLELTETTPTLTYAEFIGQELTARAGLL